MRSNSWVAVRGCDPERVDLLSPPLLRAFGGVAAVGPDGSVELGGPKQRAVLALLLLEPGVAVPSTHIIDLIWGDAPPARAAVSVRGYVSNLRKALALVGFEAATVIEFRGPGLRPPGPSGGHRPPPVRLARRRGRSPGQATGTAGGPQPAQSALDLYAGLHSG
jgi:hypothetical protein